MTRAIIRRFFQTNANDRQRNGRRKQTPNMNTGRALFSFSLSLPDHRWLPSSGGGGGGGSADLRWCPFGSTKLHQESSTSTLSYFILLFRLSLYFLAHYWGLLSCSFHWHRQSELPFSLLLLLPLLKNDPFNFCFHARFLFVAVHSLSCCHSPLFSCLRTEALSFAFLFLSFFYFKKKQVQWLSTFSSYNSNLSQCFLFVLQQQQLSPYSKVRQSHRRWRVIVQAAAAADSQS